MSYNLLLYDFVPNRDGKGKGPNIVCTQPRRVAACSLDFREVWPEELGSAYRSFHDDNDDDGYHGGDEGEDGEDDEDDDEDDDDEV